MNKSVKKISALLASLLLCTLLIETATTVKAAEVTNFSAQSDISLEDSETLDLDHPILIHSTERLTPDQQKQVNESIETIINELDKNPELYASDIGQQLISNTEKRGKAGLTAKAAAKILKASLKKMGKKKFNALVKSTGLKAVGLNWGAINKVADLFGNFGGKVDSALTKAFKKIGFSTYWAGVAARTISTIFF